MKIKRRFGFIATIICINLLVFCFRDNAYAEEKLKEPFLRAGAFIEISLRYIKLNNYYKAEYALAWAYKIARNIEEPFSRSIIFNEIVDKYIMLGQNGKALGIAQTMEFSDVQFDAFAKIAYRYVETGEYKKASAIGEKIEDYFTRAQLLYKVVDKLTDLGLYREAIKIAIALEDYTTVVKKLFVVQGLAKKMPQENARETDGQLFSQFNSSKEPHQRAEELVGFAEQYFYLCLGELAKKILFRAFLTAEEIKQDTLRKDILNRIEIISSRISQLD